MAIIKGILLEEYSRLLDKRTNYIETLQSQVEPKRQADIEQRLAGIEVDIKFIENAFKGNSLNIQAELITFIENSRRR